MAEQEENVKLFVGQVPKNFTKTELLELFQPFGAVLKFILVYNRRGRSNFCFLTCPSIEEAEKIINEFHGKITLRGASNPLNVKYADEKSGRTGRSMSDAQNPNSDNQERPFNAYDYQPPFYGHHLASAPSSSSVATSSAGRGIQASAGLMVNNADRKKGRIGNEVFVCKLPQGVSYDDVYALFSGYGKIKRVHIARYVNKITKGYGFVKFETRKEATAAIHALDGKHTMKGSSAPLVVQWPKTDRHARMDQRAMSESHEAPNNQNPYSENHGGAFPMGGINPPFNTYQTCNAEPVTYLPPLYSQALYNSIMQGVTVATSSAGGHRKGPPRANLVVKNIPIGITPRELENEFQHFGRILSVCVLVDRTTGIVQCYGYVSYDSPIAARNAVHGMNGFQLEDKTLTVEYDQF